MRNQEAAQMRAVLVDEGTHDAELIDVRTFSGSFGDRVGLVFRIGAGAHGGVELLESAALNGSARGKLAELLRGLGGGGGTLESARALIGTACRITVRHQATRAGTPYAAVLQTFKR
ncbi:MAG TPA: hypothetical protein VES73_01890 [Lamprocystis sp. (in: g-proteobacteria)]|nr:hypothetical protein [Lamprocystis sp. (in: g-proteobacteria)]